MNTELTAREREVLRHLRTYCEDHDYKCRDGRVITFNGKGWARPMDVGGHNGSDHSYVLARLVKKGYVERKARGSWGSRGS